MLLSLAPIPLAPCRDTIALTSIFILKARETH